MQLAFSYSVKFMNVKKILLFIKYGFSILCDAGTGVYVKQPTLSVRNVHCTVQDGISHSDRWMKGTLIAVTSSDVTGALCLTSSNQRKTEYRPCISSCTRWRRAGRLSSRQGHAYVEDWCRHCLQLTDHPRSRSMAMLVGWTDSQRVPVAWRMLVGRL